MRSENPRERLGGDGGGRAHPPGASPPSRGRAGSAGCCTWPVPTPRRPRDIPRSAISPSPWVGPACPAPDNVELYFGTHNLTKLSERLATRRRRDGGDGRGDESAGRVDAAARPRSAHDRPDHLTDQNTPVHAAHRGGLRVL